MFSFVLLQRDTYLSWQTESYLRNRVLSEFPILKMIPSTENKHFLLSLDFWPLMLVLRVFSPVCDLSADRELTGVSVQEEPPGLRGQVCCCSNVAIERSPAGTALGTVLKKLHTNGIQQKLSQCLLSLRQFVGILGDSKASKSKLHSPGGLATWGG